MKLTPLALLATLAPTAAALSGTETLYTIERPQDALGGWASTIEYLPDLTGDGIGELAMARRVHGGGKTRIFNGADGAFLYTITQDFHVQFFGRGIAGIGDQTGDGIPEIVIVGFRSGDSHSSEGRIHVYSGADGSVVRELTPPTDVSLREGRILALDDADGDGYEDILIRTFGPPTANPASLQLFSSVTGAMLHTYVEPAGRAILQDPVRTSDHDGDGAADFLVGITLQLGGTRHVQVRSGRTGEVLNTLSSPNFTAITGNGEPLLTMADRDSDGLEELAIGGVFTGLVGAYSSADATILREWECAEPICLGSAVINIGDLNGDGSEDLLAAEGDPAGSFANNLVGLDLVTGDRIFTEPVGGINGGYSTADPLVPMPGLDPQFPTFAMFEFSEDHVSVRRVVPSGGGFVFPTFCTPADSSLGTPARITASGSANVAANDIILGCFDLPPNQFGYFLMSETQAFITSPSGSQGNLCVGSPLVRFAAFVQNSGASGQVSFAPDELLLPNGTVWLGGQTWNFQYWTRDGQNPSNFSDLATITFCQ